MRRLSGLQSFTASEWVENTEAAWYDPKTGAYTIQGPNGAYTVSSGFQAGDIPVPADYAGNGLDPADRLPSQHWAVHRTGGDGDRHVRNAGVGRYPLGRSAVLSIAC